MGIRLLLSRSREREESESEPDDESDSDPDEPELESESESEPESESESDSEPEEDLLVELCVRAASQYDSPDGHGCSTDRLRFLCGGSFPSASLARAFSFSFKILFAVPALQIMNIRNQPTAIRRTHLCLNSSGTSTEGFPSAFAFANRLGFSNSCVRDGREI